MARPSVALTEVGNVALLLPELFRVVQMLLLTTNGEQSLPPDLAHP